MTGWLPRRRRFLGNLDRSIASLGGAEWYQTISGTAGRACGDGGGTLRFYGPGLRWFIERGCGFGLQHCKYWAEYEQRVGQALTDAGLAGI